MPKYKESVRLNIELVVTVASCERRGNKRVCILEILFSFAHHKFNLSLVHKKHVWLGLAGYLYIIGDFDGDINIYKMLVCHACFFFQVVQLVELEASMDKLITNRNAPLNTEILDSQN